MEPDSKIIEELRAAGEELKKAEKESTKTNKTQKPPFVSKEDKTEWTSLKNYLHKKRKQYPFIPNKKNL